MEGHAVHYNHREGYQIRNNLPICTLLMIITVHLPMKIACCFTCLYTNSKPSIKPPDLATWTTVRSIHISSNSYNFIIPPALLNVKLASTQVPSRYKIGFYHLIKIFLFAVCMHFSSSNIPLFNQHFSSGPTPFPPEQSP